MQRTVRSIRSIAQHYVTLLASVVLLLSHAYGIGQSLKFVSPIFNVPLAPTPGLLSGPTGLAVDVHGATYIADTNHSKIWKVDVFGTVVVFAGSGSGIYSGDGGLAVNASLNAPLAVAVDIDGNVFIADSGNSAVRRVDAVTGIITTVAGGNGSGYSGDGGPATSAKLKLPSGLAVDNADNIYVSDVTSAVVRKISITGTITTFAGGGTSSSGNGDGGQAPAAKLTTPYGLALDPTGNLYIADQGASVVREVALTNIITTFAGSTYGNSGMGGPATSAKLEGPRGVAADNSGNIYIADGQAGQVTIVDSTNTIRLLAGQPVFGSVGDGLPALYCQLATTFGIAVDSNGNVFLDSNTNNALYKIIQHPDRFPFTKVGMSSAPQRLIVENTGSTQIVVTAQSVSGDFSIVPAATDTIANVRSCLTFYGTLTASPSSSFCTVDVIFTPTAAGIRTFNLTITSNDTPTTTILPLTSTGMSPTMAVSGATIFNVAGQIAPFITSRQDNVLATTVFLSQITGLAFDHSGNIYFTEESYCDVRKVDAKTDIISTVAGNVMGLCGGPGGGGSPTPDGIPATSAILDAADGIAIGPDNTLYISDATNRGIWAVNPQGIIRHVAGVAQQSGFPCNVSGDGGLATAVKVCGEYGMAVDSNGNLIFGEIFVNAIRKITPAGIISTIGGTFGAPDGHTGDGGPALSAQIDEPWGLVLDSHNNIYFSERHSDVVRKIDATTGIITTIVGSVGINSYTGDGGLATKATLSSPEGLGIDAAGNLYIADSGNQAIRKVDAATGIITTIAGNITQGDLDNPNGNIPSTSTGVYFPYSVAVDSGGYVLFADSATLVREISPNGLLDFGNQQVSTTSNFQTLSLSNVGNLPMHFDSTTPYAVAGDFAFVTGGTCDFTQTLAVGASCTARFLFTPTAAYERYGTVTFNDDGAASPQVTELRGNGLQPAASLGVLTPNPLVFPGQTINTTSASATLTLSNPGTSTLNITGISLVGANPTNFTRTSASTCGTAVPAGGTCTIVLTFTPTLVASFTATVMVTDDAVTSPQTAVVSGNGIAAAAPQAVLTPTTVTFAGQTTGTTSASQTLTLSNPGNATLTISGITLTGGNAGSFAILSTSTCGSTLAANTTCTILATFTPSATGTLTATVNVADNATGSPQTAALTGTGTAVVVAADFTISATPASATVAGGSPAAYTINLASLLSTNPFKSSISLSATGLPTGATVNFNPPVTSIASGPASSIMTILTLKSAALQGTQASDTKHSLSREGIVSVAFLFFSFVGFRKRRNIPRLLMVLFLVAMGGFCATGLTGCGGGFALPGTSTPKTYTITVTGTGDDGTKHSTTVTLTVN